MTSPTPVPERPSSRFARSGTDEWLVVIDPQNIFAAPDSEWGSPFFDGAMANIRLLAERFGENVLVTRWTPTADRSTS